MVGEITYTDLNIQETPSSLSPSVPHPSENSSNGQISLETSQRQPLPASLGRSRLRRQSESLCAAWCRARESGRSFAGPGGEKDPGLMKASLSVSFQRPSSSSFCPCAPPPTSARKGASEVAKDLQLAGLLCTRKGRRQARRDAFQESRHRDRTVIMCEEGKANSGDPTDNEKSDCNGNSKNEPQASGNTELMIEPSQGAEPPGLEGRGWMANLREKPFWIAFIIGCAIVSVVWAPIVFSMNKSSPDPCPFCPSGWVGYERKCYYFSKAESDWDSSQRNCSSYGASLATIDTKEELDFIFSYPKHAYHWFGLQRKNNQTWEWTKSSEFNSSLFQFGADGDCAYLNDVSSMASSTWCTTIRYWICSKSLSTF